MAHFAQINENNFVVQVIVGVDEPHDGEAIYQQTTGKVWKKTSYNTLGGKHLLGGTAFRKNYAGIGYLYDAERDAFIPPKPYKSWILDEETCLWNAPIPYPDLVLAFDKIYSWDEANIQWIAE